ncbi:transcriptional regulator with XRE-family HTH domain [Streptacidiphilus sp. MAP12-20]|uniref:helix-turn-helix transcriptional regulator n=1 Tax=Streptacidiphilus sp. MAP12-20 TaxID=3156299 RepID=UPI00351439E5
MDSDALGHFLRTRREALQPEDVGLPARSRRRTAGLRREDVAELSGMSADYFARLERGSGPQPSEQMTAALARGLRLSLDERDHLFRLAGHGAPRRELRAQHVSPGLMRVLDRLDDTPAQIMGALGETLVQTRLAIALLGDETQYTGAARSAVHRWFTDPAARRLYPAEDHAHHSRVHVALLRGLATQQGPHSPAAELARSLTGLSQEFAEIWNDHQVGVQFTERKRFIHPEVGRLDLYCQILLDPDRTHSLLIFTATPGSDSHDKLALLAVLGAGPVVPIVSRR